MKRFILLTLACLLMLAGCGDGERLREQSQLDELYTQLEEKEEQLQQARDALAQLESSVEELGYAVNRLAQENDDFMFEDWRLNVADVQQASLAVRRAYSDVEQDMEELKLTLNQ